jgi:ParB family chromosome partitioning protein
MSRIQITLIEIGDRLRAASSEQVSVLSDSMEEVGLISPITVYEREVVRGGIAVQGWGLIAGLHRLEAARNLGWDEIEAHVTSLDDLHRQLAECDENLCGPKLSPSERARFTVRRKAVYEALHPETRHGAIGNGREKGRQVGDSTADRFSADTALRTGRSERDVQRDASRGERVTEEALAVVTGTAADRGVVLDALAQIPRERQADEARRYAEAPRSKPVPLPKNELETEDDWRAAMMRLWNRAPDEWRERFIDYVQEPVFDGTGAGRG